jgi:hypothetical protein
MDVGSSHYHVFLPRLSAKTVMESDPSIRQARLTDMLVELGSSWPANFDIRNDTDCTQIVRVPGCSTVIDIAVNMRSGPGVRPTTEYGTEAQLQARTAALVNKGLLSILFRVRYL